MDVMTISEYTGQLIGGPNDGDFVEATVTRIPVANTSLMWLDGVSEKVASRRILGEYVWDSDSKYFKWHPEGIGFNTRGT